VVPLDLRPLLVTAEIAGRAAKRDDWRSAEGRARCVRTEDRRNRGRLRAIIWQPRRCQRGATRFGRLPQARRRFGPIVFHRL